ncbi:nucleoside monophosphate kinase, partial [bacterium]|nr:nucleoside monophosphate kinase [bacterium]
MPESIKKVVLIGPQASGKSTQSKVITDFLGIPVVSSSQVLRGVIAKGTDLGKKIKSMMDQGVLVPDENMINFFLEALEETRCLKGFLLD